MKNIKAKTYYRALWGSLHSRAFREYVPWGWYSSPEEAIREKISALKIDIDNRRAEIKELKKLKRKT